MLKSRQYFQNNCLVCTNEQESTKLKEQFGDSLFSTTSVVYGYSKSTPIYIKDKNEQVFMLHQHPERTCEWPERKEQINVTFAFIPQLRLQGVDNETINRIKKAFDSHPSSTKSIFSHEPYAPNMTPVQVQNSMEDYFEI